MDDAERKITICYVLDDNAECRKIIDLTHVLIMLGELLVKRINGFNATRNLKVNFLFGESGRNFLLDFLERFGGGRKEYVDYGGGRQA